VVTIQPGEDFHDYLDRDMETITNEIEDTLKQIVSLDLKIKRANRQTRLIEDFPNELSPFISKYGVTIEALLAIVVPFREQAAALNRISLCKKREMLDTASVPLARVATFDLDEYRKKYERTEQLCIYISTLIDRMDVEIEIH
jgi:hypothetical protein